MIEKAIKYIVGLAAPNLHEIKGQTYSDKTLQRVSHNPKADPLKMNSLSSLVDYIHSNFDKRGDCFIHIVSPTEVRLYSVLDDDREREYLATVNAQLPSFRFNEFIGLEEFCINLQSKFLDGPDRALLLKFAGTVETGSVAQYGDDGVTQKATIKSGVASKADAVVPNPVKLEAYRTFVEVDQPSSKYIFRMKQNSAGGVTCGLFEADGGAWQIEAKKAILDYLKMAFSDEMDLVIIA